MLIIIIYEVLFGAVSPIYAVIGILVGLFIGIIVGTYSSVFIATPATLLWSTTTPTEPKPKK